MRKEIKARDILLSEGYEVQMRPPQTRFQKQKDLYGLWDMIAIRSDGVRFIQVKSTRAGVRKPWREKAKDFPCPKSCSKEVWIMKDRKKNPEIILL